MASLPVSVIAPGGGVVDYSAHDSAKETYLCRSVVHPG